MEDMLPELPSLDHLESSPGADPASVPTPPSLLHSTIPPAPEIKPVELPKEVNPVEKMSEVKPVEPPKEIKPIEKAPEIKPIEPPKLISMVAPPSKILAPIHDVLSAPLPSPRRQTEPMVIEAMSYPTPAVEAKPIPAQRLLALDAFRGFIMMLLASTGFGIVAMAKKTGNETLAEFAPYFKHTLWSGCTLWDLIQPAFMFMVGAAMPFSYSKRLERGESTWKLLDHAVIRAVVLILLGVFLAAQKGGKTNWEFTNVLAQIGLGYLFVFAFWRAGTWAQVLGFIGILVGYGFLFANHDLDPSYAYQFTDGQFQAKDLFTGFYAHWNPHTNIATQFDQWFLNLFPRADGKSYVMNEGGYQTLNFVPAIATMLLGLMAGRFVKSERGDGFKTIMLLVTGAALAVGGWAVGENLCPVVKRLWTPSWVMLSGGFVLMMLSAFYAVVEWFDMRWIGKIFAVLGMNCIFVYLANQLSKGFIVQRLNLHVFSLFKEPFVKDYGPALDACGFLAVVWLLCWWLYRQRAFLRI